MNKTELIAKVAEGAGLSKVSAKCAIEAAIASIKCALKNGEKVQIPGVVSLSVAKRPARTCKNPQTGATITVAAKNIVKIKAGSELNALVK